MLARIGQSKVQRLHQHNIGHSGDSFTSQKTQPTVPKVLKVWRVMQFNVMHPLVEGLRQLAVHCMLYMLYVHMHILKVWSHIKNLTLSIDALVTEEQLCQISTGSDLKRQSLRLF